MNQETRNPGKGKSAFPVYAKDDGMTLRDHAYIISDAMMKEREKP